MPSLNEHIKIGAVTGAVAGGVLNGFIQFDRMQSDSSIKFDLGEFLGSIIMGASIAMIACMLPDILEPANHPNHRHFFHSFTAGGILLFFSYKVNNSQSPVEVQILLQCALSGYVSHLLADSATPMGLKII